MKSGRSLVKPRGLSPMSFLEFFAIPEWQIPWEFCNGAVAIFALNFDLRQSLYPACYHHRAYRLMCGNPGITGHLLDCLHGFRFGDANHP